MSKGSSQNSSNTETPKSQKNILGDPNCPICGGVGYLRFDVPVGHPQFGKLQICSCRQAVVFQKTRDRLYSISNLNKLDNLTFETFNPRGQIGLGPYQAESIERAYNQARQFASNQDGWLLIQGKYGCGKTHLAAAIANYAASLGMSALFITVPDLLDTLRHGYNNPDFPFEQRFNDIRRAQLLILDDFGTQNATNWAQEKLFQILNFRYINKLSLVVTTNLSLDQIEGRIRSRLQDPELVTRVQIMAPDFRRPYDDTGHHDLSALKFLSHLTFGNFDLRLNENLSSEETKSLEKAFRAAQNFAHEPQGWLLFLGTFGSGKTHIAAAIANFRAGLGLPPLFIMVPDFLDHLRATFAPDSNTKYDRLFDEIRKTPLLILDDLGTQSMTPWVREKLYQLFNYRYMAELPTVVTMSDSIEDFYRNEPRLASRMLDPRICAIYAIMVPTYRGVTLSRTKGKSSR